MVGFGDDEQEGILGTRMSRECVKMSEERKVSPEALLALFRARRSIRRYRLDPVPQVMIEQLLEAGRWAPSANNLQPWRFIVVQDASIRDQIAQCTHYLGYPRVHLNESPVVIVLCGVERDRVYHEFLNGDVAMAALQMMLQAKTLGLGTCWVGGLNREAVAGLLRIPDPLEVVCLMTVGFPAAEPGPTSRRPLDEILHYDLYGSGDDNEKVLPGVPVRPPPGPGRRFVNWVRRVLGRPV
jgi:nitroreductase